jgi:choline dehydrogenase-like flavoprotein
MSHSVLSALNARILRPGSSASTDALILDLLASWKEAQEGVGVELNLRQFSEWGADQPHIVRGLQNISHKLATDRDWRISIITGLLWPRGSALRGRSLDASHQFVRYPPTDWEIVRDSVRDTAQTVSIEDKEWQARLGIVLLRDGIAVLSAPLAKNKSLKLAALACLAEPIDAGYLLVYPRVIGWAFGRQTIEITLDLREAFQ